MENHAVHQCHGREWNTSWKWYQKKTWSRVFPIKILYAYLVSPSIFLTQNGLLHSTILTGRYTKSQMIHDTLNSHIIVYNTYQAICLKDISHSTWRTYHGDRHHNVRVHRTEIQQTPHQMYPRMVQMDFLLLHYIHCHCP